jgi:opacity protein-like surface antigen
MKKAIKVLLVIAVVISLSSFAYSAPGFYAGGNVGIALLNDSDMSDSELPSNASISADNGFSTGGFIGYSFMNNFRIEGELVYQGNDLDEMELYDYDFDMTGDISSVALFANAYYDFNNSSRFTPFVGVGIGFANVEVNDTGIIIAGVNYDLGDDDDTVLAYHLDAGVSYGINERFALDVKYRYMETEDPDFSGTEVEYSSHNIYTGLRVSF